MAPKESKVHPGLFNETHQMVVDAIRAKLPRQTTYDHVKIIRHNCDPTDEELARFYAEIHNHLLEVASVSINKNVDFFEPEEGFADNFDPEIADEVPVLRPETQAWEVPVGLTALMDDIIHDYHDLSVGTLLIWLSELEEKLRVAERARFKTDGQLTAALVAFNRYAPHVNFRGPNDHFQLDMVAGKGLYAPMFHSEIVRLIGTRLRNYDKKIRKLTDVSY